MSEKDIKEIKGCILLKDKVIIEEQEQEIERLRQENTQIGMLNADLSIYLKEHKARIDKAIEYIENNSLYDIEYDEDIYENVTYTSGANDEIASRDLLDILKGE